MKTKILKYLPMFCVTLVLCLWALLGMSCSDVEEKIKLDNPTNIQYDIDTHKVSWDFVDNASSYVVTFDGANEQTVKTNSVTYSSKAEEFEFTIQAKSDSIYTSSDTVSMTFVKLNSNIELTVSDDGILTWEEVNGATGYEVSINGSQTVKVTTTSYEELPEGSSSKVKVKPVRDNQSGIYYYASWSETKTITKLGQVDSQTIQYEDNIIKWNSVSNASSYKVIINDEEFTTTKNSLEYSAGNQNFAVSIQAIGNHETSFDGNTGNRNFVYLDVVTGITVEDGILTWAEVENADAYKLKLQSNTNTPINLTTNSYDKLVAGTQYTVSVLPISTATDTAYFSNWSQSESVYILPSPDIKWTGDLDVADEQTRTVINWNLVDLASGYTYKITNPDGEEVENTLPIATNFIQTSFTSVGTYTFAVKANANDEAGKYDSAYSNAITVVKLAAPTITDNNISSNETSLTDGFTVSFESIPNAAGYKLYKNEVENKSSTTPQFRVTDIVEEDNLREVTINYYVQSLGSKSSNGNVIYLSSSFAQASGSSAFSITVLQTPTNPTIEGNGFGADYKFDAVAHQYGYNVLISGSSYTSEGTTMSINPTGSSEIKVCSKGNGKNVLASTYSTSITVVRLNSPYDISIDTGQSDGLLKFSDDNSSKALSYQLVFNGDEANAIPVDTTTNIKDRITTQGTILYMYAIANYFDNVQENIYYMTSKHSDNKEFIKLEAPDKINFDNTTMTWNSPTNISSSASYTPQYKIFNYNNNTVYNGQFTGLSYPLTEFEAGTYTFAIQALGDGQRYINSEVAVSKAITKLRTPDFTVNVLNSTYEWDSVASASSYILSIDGKNVSQDYHTSGNTYTYSPTYESIGEHLVTLYAQGDGGNTTINSSTFEYKQVVQQLQTPTFEYAYSLDNYNVDGLIKMQIVTQSPYCIGYTYNIGGTAHKESTTSFEFNPNTAGRIELSVYANGGGFDANEVYYSDSQLSSVCYMNLLTYPSVDEITINSDGVISWPTITNALGYEYKLSIITTDNEEYTVEDKISTNTASLDLSGGVKVNKDGLEVKIKYNQIKRLSIELSATGSLKKDTYITSTNSYVSSEKKTKAWESDLH